MKTNHPLTEILIFRIKNIGQIPLCGSGERHHAMVIGDFCFPICNRCLAAITTILIMPHIPVWKEALSQQSMFIIGLLAIVPCAIDGFAQYALKIESDTLRRFVSGGLLGVGLSLIKYAVT